jgi:malonate-semialdehyde dehydrogenase (acetylating)/methylmalonate-semialdehyde dehydrogenase
MATASEELTGTVTGVPPRLLDNYVGGEWVKSEARECLPVTNPATAEVIANVPLSTAIDVDRAARKAHQA